MSELLETEERQQLHAVFDALELASAASDASSSSSSSDANTLGEVPPELLISSVSALLDPTIYKSVLRERRRRAKKSEADQDLSRRVELAHTFLRGFATQEQQKQSRNTVRDILNKALEGPSALDGFMQVHT